MTRQIAFSGSGLYSVAVITNLNPNLTYTSINKTHFFFVLKALQSFSEINYPFSSFTAATTCRAKMNLISIEHLNCLVKLIPVP